MNTNTIQQYDYIFDLLGTEICDIFGDELSFNTLKSYHHKMNTNASFQVDVSTEVYEHYFNMTVMIDNREVLRQEYEINTCSMITELNKLIEKYHNNHKDSDDFETWEVPAVKIPNEPISVSEQQI